jgi:hypothetical protein
VDCDHEPRDCTGFDAVGAEGDSAHLVVVANADADDIRHTRYLARGAGGAGTGARELDDDGGCNVEDRKLEACIHDATSHRLSDVAEPHESSAQFHDGGRY